MKHNANRRSVSSRMFIAMLALVLVIGCAVGGTVAWLVAKTDPVVNTFSYGDINITLTETKPENKQAKIIPGVDIEKNPTVTVKAGSEACWLFVKVDEENWPAFVEADKTTKKVSYAIADGWTQGDGTNIPANVYYREVPAATADASFGILKGDKVTVSDTLTKEDVNSITAGTQPKLTFTAYAIQRAGTDTAAEAWANVGVTP